MAKLIAVKLDDGKQIMVEADDLPLPVGVKPVSLREDGQIEFSSALDTIKSAATQLQKSLLSMVSPPDGCEISFGVKLSASAGVILAKAGTEANFTIKMNWSAKK
jgi:Trypsin-co-occurring domain 1